MITDAPENVGYDVRSEEWDEMYDTRADSWEAMYDLRADAWESLYDARSDTWESSMIEDDVITLVRCR